MSDAHAVIEATRVATPPVPLDVDKVWLAPTPTGWVKFDFTGDEYRDLPRRKKGTTVVENVGSFLAYWEKHHTEGMSEVYADLTRRTVTAVLDAHSTTAAGWAAHRLVLALRHSPSLNAWRGISGTMMPQLRFAEFIEDHRPDIIEPDAADVLELAESFQATTTAVFKSGTILKSGQRELQYQETIDATAGHTKRMPIPDALTLALLVFEGDDSAEAITARLRYRTGDGKLQLGVILDEVEEKVRSAFDAIVDQIGGSIAAPVLRGTPAVGS